jgi:trehalose 6-phosphate synthase
MSQLIIVSNRVTVPGKSEAGGLAVALSDMLKDKGGVWCGWSGKTAEYPRTCEQVQDNVRYVTMDFTQTDYDDFYIGFCNSMLWPLFHYRLDLTRYSPSMYESYQSVNRAFAQKIAKFAGAGDAIWVHDYHLMAMASHLRELNVQERIGFFLHIPFPVPEVFTALPMHMEILKSLCAYDVVGFQTDTDLQAFLRCIGELGGGRKVKSPRENVYEVQAFGRKFKAGRFSISIDTSDLMMVADRAEIEPKTQKLRQSLDGRKMIVGVDRLDYTKGLMHRLSAFDHLLQQHPEHNNEVSFIQITPPSRTDVEEYGKMREQLEGLAANINGKHAEIDWVPIRYINKSYSREELAGIYRSARVGLVTPLRDGMNLVAKEYVASQNPDDPGVLILSQFAGAAQEMECGALMVNPYDEEDMAERIHQALTMPLIERKARYEAMIAVLKRNDIFRWTKRFTEQLTSVEDEGASKEEFIILPKKVQIFNHLSTAGAHSASIM